MILATSSSFTILQMNFTLMSQCPGKGAEIEILMKSLSVEGLIYGRDYDFECVDTLDEVQEKIMKEDVVAFGGIRPTKDMSMNGIKFTHPTYYSGLNIMIKKVDVNDPMKLFKVFTFSVWVVFCLSPLVVGVFSWIYNVILDKKFLKFSFLIGSTWDAYSAMMFYSGSNNKIARFEEMTLGIYIRLFFMILTAAYASNTYQKLVTFIQKFGDLAGQLVLIEPKYEDLCGQFAIFYYSFSHDFYSDFSKAIDLLQEKKYWGIIADHTFLIEKMRQNSGVKINTYPFLTFTYAGIYRNLSSSIITKINSGLSLVQQSEFPVQIQDKYGLIEDFKSTTQEILAVEDTFGIFISILIICCVGIAISFLPFQGLYSENWDYCCRRHARLFDELETTQRNDALDLNRKSSVIAIESIESAWAADLSQEFVRLIKICTLNIIEYENKSFSAFDLLMRKMKEGNMEKLEIISQVDKFFQNVD